MKDLWDEKNSTGHQMNCANKSRIETNDITSDIETKYSEIECADIGKIWKRNCPKCGIEIVYSSKGNLTASIKRNCFCRRCSNFIKRWNKTSVPEKKNCKYCDKEIHHKKTFCGKPCFDAHQTFPTTNCTNCGGPSKYNTQYCSRKCWTDFNLKKRTRNCRYCGCLLIDYKKTEFCSYQCRGLHRIAQREIKKCKLCGTEFTNTTKRVKFCCHTCSATFQLRYGNRVSKPELKVREMLKSLGVPFTPSYPLENKIFDIFIPSKNLLIEIDGVYWHGRNKDRLNDVQKKNIENDQIKTRLAEKYGYTLIRVWEDEIKNVSKHIL